MCVCVYDCTHAKGGSYKMRVLRRNSLHLNALKHACKREQTNSYCLHVTRGPQSTRACWPCSECKGRCTLKMVVQARGDFYLPLTELATVTLVHHVCWAAHLLLWVEILTYEVGRNLGKRGIQRFGRLGSRYCSSELRHVPCQLVLATADSWPRLVARQSPWSRCSHCFLSHGVNATVLNAGCKEFIAFPICHVVRVTWHAFLKTRSLSRLTSVCVK